MLHIADFQVSFSEFQLRSSKPTSESGSLLQLLPDLNSHRSQLSARTVTIHAMASSTTPLLRAAAVRNAVAQNARMAPRYTRQASGHGAATASAEQYPAEGESMRTKAVYRI